MRRNCKHDGFWRFTFLPMLLLTGWRVVLTIKFLKTKYNGARASFWLDDKNRSSSCLIRRFSDVLFTWYCRSGSCLAEAAIAQSFVPNFSTLENEWIISGQTFSLWKPIVDLVTRLAKTDRHVFFICYVDGYVLTFFMYFCFAVAKRKRHFIWWTWKHILRGMREKHCYRLRYPQTTGLLTIMRSSF